MNFDLHLYKCSSGQSVPGCNDLFSSFKFNKVMLKEELNIKVRRFIEDRIAVENVTMFYQIANRYMLNSIAELVFDYIKRCFAMVVETENFLKLEYKLVSKILYSSDLNNHSEREVFNAADKWLSYNVKERSMFAKQLLLTVRFPLLSDHAIEYILTNNSSFSENNECVKIQKVILDQKQIFFQKMSGKYYTHRYCNQNKFNIVICGGYDDKYRSVNLANSISKVNQIAGNNFKYVKSISSLLEKRKIVEAVCLKDKIYVFGSRRNYETPWSVEKFSTETWNKAADMPDQRYAFCACAFMNNIFVNGGLLVHHLDLFTEIPTVFNSCLRFDTEDDTWKEASRMGAARCYAACAVFEGNVVVAGGIDNNSRRLNTVESYDVAADKWFSMPNMISGKSHHSLVVARSKLFVIAHVPLTCEVFDSICRKFIVLKSPPIVHQNKAISFGNKILIVHNKTQCIAWYDVEEDKWSEELSKAAKRRGSFSCLKLPWY